MPRPKQKPPTEGGKRLKAELNSFINECIIEKETEKLSDKEIKSAFNFFIDKIASLEDQIKELSKD